VGRAEAAQVTGRILAEMAVNDLTVEDPPIEDVIELAFASGRPDPAGSPAGERG
jgi:ABC-2 type transport system ATP-binding protein